MTSIKPDRFKKKYKSLQRAIVWAMVLTGRVDEDVYIDFDQEAHCGDGTHVKEGWNIKAESQLDPDDYPLLCVCKDTYDVIPYYATVRCDKQEEEEEKGKKVCSQCQ